MIGAYFIAFDTSWKGYMRIDPTLVGGPHEVLQVGPKSLRAAGIPLPKYFKNKKKQQQHLYC